MILTTGGSDEFHLSLLIRFWKPVIIFVTEYRTHEEESKLIFHFILFWSKLEGLKFPLTTR